MATMERKMQEKGAVVMHALTQAMEAAVSRFRHDDMEAKAVQVISLLNRSMTHSAGMEAEENAQALEQAVHTAEELARRGYGGFAQAIGQAMHFYYNIPQGEVEALVLPELLRSYGERVEKSVAEVARKTNIVAIDLPDDRTARLFISWIEQQRVLFEMPEYIAPLRTQDLQDIIDDALDVAIPLYRVPVFYDAIDLEQFLAPLLPPIVLKE